MYLWMEYGVIGVYGDDCSVQVGAFLDCSPRLKSGDSRGSPCDLSWVDRSNRHGFFCGAPRPIHYQRSIKSAAVPSSNLGLTRNAPDAGMRSCPQRVLRRPERRSSHQALERRLPSSTDGFAPSGEGRTRSASLPRSSRAGFDTGLITVPGDHPAGWAGHSPPVGLPAVTNS